MIANFIVITIIMQLLVLFCFRLRHHLSLAITYSMLVILSVLLWRFGYADLRLSKDPQSLLLVDIAIYSSMMLQILLLYIYEGDFAARVGIGICVVSALVPSMNLLLISLSAEKIAVDPMFMVPLLGPGLLSALVTIITFILTAVTWECIQRLEQWLPLVVRVMITVLGVLLLDLLFREFTAFTNYLYAQDITHFGIIGVGVAVVVATLSLLLYTKWESLPTQGQTEKQLFSIFSGHKEMQQEVNQLRETLERMHAPVTTAEGINAASSQVQAMLNSPVIQVFSLDLDFRYTLFNETHRQLMQRVTGNEIGVGMEYLALAEKIINKEEGLRFFNQIVRGETSQKQQAYLSIEGERIVYDMRYYPTLTSDGYITGVTGFGVDITEQKWAVDRLKESEERWQLALEGSQDGIWDWDVVNNAFFYSPRWYAMLGYQEGDMSNKGQEWLSIIHPDDRVKTLRELQSHTSGDTAFYISEHRKRHKEGYYFWVLERGKALFNRQGFPARLLGTVSNINPRKEAEERLKASEEQLRYAFEVADEGIWDIDLQQNRVFYSPRYITMMGYSPDEFGHSLDAWIKYVHPDDQEHAREFLLHKVVEEGEHEAQFRMVHKNGEVIHMLSRAKVVAYDVNQQPARVIGIHKDITDRVLRMEQIENMAFYDSLTNLPNRRLLFERAQQSLSIAKRHNHSMAVMLIDLDKFKHINDTLGHDVGDGVLVELGRRVKSCLREMDTLCRQGGDEFTVILPECNSVLALDLANRIHDTFHEPCNIHGNQVQLEASIGIACFPEDGDTLSELFKNADVAMYQAKHKGLEVSLFQEEQAEVMQRRARLEKDLQHAIGSSQMYLLYQPRLSLLNGEVTAAEVLARWDHPEYQMIPPSEFIPIAEQSGLIHRLGRWVLEQSIIQAASWKHQGYSLRVAINVSAYELQNHQLHTNIRDLLNKHQLQGSDIELELTETAVMSNVESSVMLLNDIKELGVGISIDDFGTGYSSLSYLNRLPISCVKIDKQFVHQISSSTSEGEDDVVIVRSIITLAKTMGLRTVAEGVETIEQQQYLQHLSCDEAQGYLYCNPLDPDGLENYLRTHQPINKIAS
ncbi:EAL domain-containing protein [Zooshikella ganghwensis]|uniref:EAL domain-containing protein n=2 Tax=Zooshikella ganghwensis TaxID=202772 RepID=A0A4P9VJQ2_9GAMM|nr:EAL domain-containing protein [Zooshikella ganghwensis]